MELAEACNRLHNSEAFKNVEEVINLVVKEIEGDMVAYDNTMLGYEKYKLAVNERTVYHHFLELIRQKSDEYIDQLKEQANGESEEARRTESR